MISGFKSAFLFDFKLKNKLEYLRKIEFKNVIFSNCENNLEAENLRDSFETQNFVDI